MDDVKTVYTVGHSNIESEKFIYLLKKHSITCIADIRSVPYSSFAPHFNKDQIKQILELNKIAYVYLGKELGARQKRPDLLDNQNRLIYTKYQKTESFQFGIMRINDGIRKGFRIAIMCSEADPFECHRFVMVSSYLTINEFMVLHILHDGSLVDNSQLEEKLLQKYSKILPKNNLFEHGITKDLQITEAYRLANERIAFKNDEDGGIVD